MLKSERVNLARNSCVCESERVNLTIMNRNEFSLEKQTIILRVACPPVSRAWYGKGTIIF